MDELFFQRNWEEGGINFYFHFKNSVAVRQIEISASKKVLLSKDKPFDGDSMLYDQSLSELEFDVIDLISDEEFEAIWNSINEEN